MFDLFETEFIHNPTILVCLNNSIGRRKIIIISIFKMILTYYNNKWKYRPTIKINVLDHSDPFPITKLHNFNFLIPVVRCYNKDGYDLAYKKVYLVEVLNIGLHNIIFDNYILKKSKSNPNNLWIFILGLLIIIRTIPTYTEL